MAQNSQSYVHFISDAPVDTTFPDAYKSHLITDLETLKLVLSKPVDLVAFDTETTGLNPEKDFIVGFSFSLDAHNGYYVPVKHFNGGLGTPALELIYNYMCSCPTVAMHNCRFDMRMMEWHGFTDLNLKEQQMWLDIIPYEENKKFGRHQRQHYLKFDMSKIKYFDTQVSCFLSDTNDQRTSLKKYEMKFLGWKSDTFEEALGDNSNWFYTDYNEFTTYRYASLDTIGTYNLAIKTKRFVDEAKMSGYLDNGVLYPVGRVEELLQPIDKDLLLKYHEELSKELEDIQNRCWSHAGRPFNLGSVKEKGEIMESLGIYTGSRTKSGNMATGKSVIEKALEQMDKADPNYQFMEDLVKYNNVKKQLTSYVDNIIEMCEADAPLRENLLRFNYKLTLVPCLTKENVVYLKDKGLVSIKECKEGDYIWTQYGFKKVLWNREHWTKDLWKVKFSNGSWLVGTGHHPVLVNNKIDVNKGKPNFQWAAIQDLNEREKVVLNSHMVKDSNIGVLKEPDESKFEDYRWKKNTSSNHFKYPEITEKFVQLCGFIDGDGTINKDRIKLCFNKKEYQEGMNLYVDFMCNSFGITREQLNVYEYRDNTVSVQFWSPKLAKYLLDLGLKSNSVPNFIKQGNPELWRFYIAGYFDTDGSVCRSKFAKYKDVYSCRIRSNNYFRLYDIYEMMLFLNINCAFKQGTNDSYKPRFDIKVSSKYGINQFNEYITPLLICNHKRERAYLAVVDKYYDLNHTSVEYVEKLDDVGIVYDIEVEDVHEYIANGIVTHNTGRLAAGGDKKSNGYWANLNIQNIPKPHPADYHVTTVEDCKINNPDLLKAGIVDGKLADVWYYEYNGRTIKIDRIFNYLMTKVEWTKIVIDKDGHTHKYPKDFPFNNEGPTAKIMEGADQHLNIRSIFKPMSSNHYLMSLDYSGQELRACAILSGEPAWTDAFAHGKDVHKSTACKIWGEENYDKEKRKKAKAANFGIIYGMGAYTLASRNGMTPEEGEEFFKQFQEGLPTLFSWISYTHKLGKKQGTVYTMFGRPRRVAYWYNHPDYKMHAFADRTCTNSIVQGCLRYNTRVLTNNGLRNIGDIWKSGDKVKVWTGFRYADAIALNRGKAKIVVVNTVSGNKIECDNRHKFKVEENNEYLWKDINDLRIGDKLTMSYNNSQKLDIEYWYYLCGYILGDGNIMYRTTYDKRRGKSYSRYNTQIVFGEHELNKAYEIKEFLEKEGYKVRLEKTQHVTKHGVLSTRYRISVTSEKLAKYLEALGMVIGSTSKTKRITENLYRHIYSVMKGLYDSDGCKKTGRFHLANKRLCDDIRLAYSMLGVKSYVRENNGVSYYCQPKDVKSVIELFNGKNKEFKEKYYTDEVKSIEFTDIEEDTYTMSVDDELHQFIAEGVVNKNTAADISKIAIMKVYNHVLKNPNNFDIVRWHSTVHDEINYHVRKDKAKLLAKEINKLMILTNPSWSFSFETGLSFGNTWGSLFDFEYDLKTCEVLHPKWEDVGPKPVEYTGEVEKKEEEKEVSLLINTEGEEFNWDL